MSRPAADSQPVLKVSRQSDGRPEIFHSLQGEGASIGTPSVFLRLAMCNLTCTWCDTAYTWDWQRYDPKSEVMELSAEQARREILVFGCRHLVVTGGEPLLQQRPLTPLIASLKGEGFSFEVETNGTVAPEAHLGGVVDQWNVSPKLANSGNAPGRREVPEALGRFAALPNAYFKFVVVEREDLAAVTDLVERYGLPGDRVILMPEGRDPETLASRGRWLSQAAVDHGFRFRTRLHILLWGDVRGT